MNKRLQETKCSSQLLSYQRKCRTDHLLPRPSEGEYNSIALSLKALRAERAKLNLQIRCEVVNAAGGIATGAAASVGLLSQLQSAIGAATTLIAGGLYAADKIKDYAPVISQLKANEEQFKDDAAFGLHNFFARIDATTRA